MLRPARLCGLALLVATSITSAHPTSNRTVKIDATATGLAAGEPVEFFLVGPKSSHGYEALAQTTQSVADIKAALVAAGFSPGQPADPNALRFQPRGERLRISVLPEGYCIPMSLVSFLETDIPVNPSPLSGFVFTGSRALTTNPLQFLADQIEPYSIISTYNEAASLIDVRGSAPQSGVYGTRTLRSLTGLTNGAPMTFFISSYFAHGTHMTNVAITATAGGFALNSQNQGKVLTGPELLDYLSVLSTIFTDVPLTLSWDENITLRDAIARAITIQEGGDTGKIIMEPPPPGQLYYRSFLPDPAHRDRANRPAQPWELRFSTNSTATLVQIEETWRDDSDAPLLSPVESVVTSGQDLQQALARAPGLPVILVFAPADVTLGKIMSFVRPSLASHSTIYLFDE